MNMLSIIKSVLRGAWRQRYLIMMPLIIVIPLSLAAALLWPKKYETSALILLQEYNGLSGDVPAYVRAQDLRDKVKSLEALITSEFILRRVMKKFHINANDPVEPTERELQEYRKRLTVEQVGTQFVQLNLTGGQKEGLGNELSAILAALFESLLSSNDTSLDATTFVLRTRRMELAELETRLRTLETGDERTINNLEKQRREFLDVERKIGELSVIVQNERQAFNASANEGFPELALDGQPIEQAITKMKDALSNPAPQKRRRKNSERARP